jgi:hypothetical protein
MTSTTRKSPQKNITKNAPVQYTAALKNKTKQISSYCWYSTTTTTQMTPDSETHSTSGRKTTTNITHTHFSFVFFSARFWLFESWQLTEKRRKTWAHNTSMKRRKKREKPVGKGLNRCCTSTRCCSVIRLNVVLGKAKVYFSRTMHVCVCVCASRRRLCRAFPNRKLGQKNRQSWSKTYQVADCGMKLLYSHSTRRDKQQ